MKRLLALLFAICLLSALPALAETGDPGVIESEWVDAPVEETELLLGGDEAEAPLPEFGEGGALSLLDFDEAPEALDSVAAAQINDGGVPLDEAHFPDSEFRYQLNWKADKNRDGILSNDEIAAVKSLRISGDINSQEGINSLEGIGYFYALTDLVVYNMHLTRLDVSECTVLQRLECSSLNKMDSLDISGCTALTYLDCSGCGLPSLDVGNCPELAYLNCGFNRLTTLDVSQCPKLTRLICRECWTLTRLNVSGCTALTYLECVCSKLAELDVSECTALKTLVCYENKLTKLDVSRCTALTELNCYNNSIGSLDISTCRNLEILSCDKNQLTTLDISTCKDLKELGCSMNQLTTLDISTCKDLKCLGCQDNQLSVLNISNCTHFIESKIWEHVKYGGWSTDRYFYFEYSGYKLIVDRSVTLYTGLGDPPTLVASIKTINIGEQFSLVASDSPIPASECDFACSNTQIVSVSETGIVTGLAAGDAVITVTAKANGKTASCVVTVKAAPGPTPTLPDSPKLKSESITINAGEKYTLLAKDSPVSASACAFFAANKKVATVSAKGVVTGVGPGETRITVTTTKGANLVCIVTVLSAPASVTLVETVLTLGTNESHTLAVELPAYSKPTKLSWSSSDRKVATVSAKGVVKALKKGSATITVSAGGGAKATCRLTVKNSPSKLTLNQDALSLKAGKQVRLKAKLSALSYTSALTWKSSNPKVATVSAEAGTNGLQAFVTAYKAGTANITVTAANGKTAACAVTVTGKGVYNPVYYRALLIGQEKFDPVCTRFSAAARAMESMLKSVQGPEGGVYQVTTKFDRNASQVKSLIRSTFAKADSNDVSLFFIATHGDTFQSIKNVAAGELEMIPSGVLRLKDLAAELKKVPGKVIVILESCGSGAAIYAGNSGGTLKDFKLASEAFDRAAVDAFSAEDPGIWADANGMPLGEGEVAPNAAAFRDTKFIVLTAAQYQERSWGTESPVAVTYFVNYLTKGIGASGRMPADANRNGVTTLNELYKYVTKKLKGQKAYKDGEGPFYQHVQVYPSNSSYALFKR